MIRNLMSNKEQITSSLWSILCSSEFFNNLIKTYETLSECLKSSSSLKRNSKISSFMINWLIGFSLSLIFYIQFNDYQITLSEQITHYFEVIINILESLIMWLMGVPAGLKLNKQLDEFLGRFFFYHIYLWNSSIAIFQELLPICTWSILLSGILGASFQVAIIKDYLNVLTIHMSCFYVYAARIYKVEFDSLRSLFRLFSGRKLNPMRKRIDSFIYGADQLFIGTLGFSIVLFLLPTVLMYYAVFLSVRLGLFVINIVLSLFVNILNNIPIYEILVYLFNIQHKEIKDKKFYSIDKSSKESKGSLQCRRVKESFSKIIQASDCGIIHIAQQYKFNTLLFDIVYGRKF